MTAETRLDLLLATLRVLHDVGLILAAGVLAFLVVAWPSGERGPHPPRLIAGGASLSALAAVAAPLVSWRADGGVLEEVVTRGHVAAVLLELAALALLAGFFRDVTRRPLRRGRRPTWAGWLAGGVAAAQALTVAAQSVAADPGRSPAETPLLAVHLLALALWIGGVATLAVVVLTGAPTYIYDDVVARFLPVAYACIAAVAVSGVVESLLVDRAPSLSTSYGLTLLVKILLFAGLVAAGWEARTYALDHAFSKSMSPTPVSTTTTSALARALVADLVIALLVLAATSLLLAVHVPGAA